MQVFILLYIFSIVAFANAYYILVLNQDQDTINEIFEGEDFFMAMIFTFKQALGDFGKTASFDNRDKPLWFTMLIAEIFICNIVFLNLLIAIMADTFDKVANKQQESKLREMCELIDDEETMVKIFSYEQLAKIILSYS